MLVFGSIGRPWVYDPLIKKNTFRPKEYTSWDDCANGVEVLYRTILQLDKQLNTH